MMRLLSAVSAPQADEIGKMKQELRRLIFDEQMRHEKRKTAVTAIESSATGHLKPWREVVTPHKDVASGRYQRAEFAADLWQVHLLILGRCNLLSTALQGTILCYAVGSIIFADDGSAIPADHLFRFCKDLFSQRFWFKDLSL